LLIKNISFHNIGKYCCYGYSATFTENFFDCGYLDLTGTIIVLTEELVFID